MHRFVRIVTVGSVLVSLVGAASAQGGGLAGALDQQRQDLQRQQSESRHEIEAQQRALQQQEDQALQRQLRSPLHPLSPQLLRPCRRVGATLLCD
jgi:hypothetical protein